MQTAVEWLWRWQMDNSFASFKEGVDAYKEAKEMEREIAISFHQWMQINDTEQNAEKYANYSDEDMFDEFLK